jgi:hypothetical protein
MAPYRKYQEHEEDSVDFPFRRDCSPSWLHRYAFASDVAVAPLGKKLGSSRKKKLGNLLHSQLGSSRKKNLVIYEHTVYFNVELNLVQQYSLISKFLVSSCYKKNMHLKGSISLASLQVYKLTGPGACGIEIKKVFFYKDRN